MKLSISCIHFYNWTIAITRSESVNVTTIAVKINYFVNVFLHFTTTHTKIVKDSIHIFIPNVVQMSLSTSVNTPPAKAGGFDYHPKLAGSASPTRPKAAAFKRRSFTDAFSKTTALWWW